MRKIHNGCDAILPYIEALKDAQQQAKCAKMPIGDATLVMYAMRAMISTEQHHKANDLWEDLDRVDRTWKEWKAIYTKANSKAIVKCMAVGNVEQFGGASNVGAHSDGGGSGGGCKPPAGRPYPVTLNELEGCFGSLAGAAVTGTETLDELVKSNATLSKSIAALTETNSRLAKKVENQAVELKKRGGGKSVDSGGVETRGGNEGAYCSNCKQTNWHTPDNCFGLSKKKEKLPLYWKSVL